MKFAIIGCGGIARAHCRAIKNLGHELVAALDPHTPAHALLEYGMSGWEFFTEEPRFFRWLETHECDWVAICSPNWLHEWHARLALNAGCNVLCEKPLALNPANLRPLIGIEEEYEQRIYTVLQMRLHPEAKRLQEAVAAAPGLHRNVEIRYTTPRPPDYFQSWKVDDARSGGIVTNIGIHLFDLMLNTFGTPDKVERVIGLGAANGTLHFPTATVHWILSIRPGERERVITMDGVPYYFTTGFEDLHEETYRHTLAGNGFTIEDARPAVELCHAMRTA